MRLHKRVLHISFTLIAWCVPVLVFAQTALTQTEVPVSTPVPHENTLIVLYSAIGVFGAASLVTFLAGAGTYFARMGLEYRLDGIRVMEWGIRLIITTLFLIGLLRFLTLYWWA